MEEKLTPPILIYDSKCSLCVRFKDSLLKLGGAEEINAVSIYTEELYDKFPELNKDECDQVVHFITKDNKILAGPEVIEHLVKDFPLVNKFSWLIESEMGKKAINYFHDMANKYRQTLKKKCPTCTK